MSFTHLHLHTEYSLLDGACRIEQLMDEVQRLGQTSVAVTDHGVMYGVIDFYRAPQCAMSAECSVCLITMSIPSRSSSRASSA